MLGKRHTEISKRKMSLAKLGKPLSKEHKEKLRPYFFKKGHKINLGKKRTKEWRENLSIKIKEQWNNPSSSYHSPQFRKKLSLANLGKKLSEEHKKKLSERKRGENHPMYGEQHSEKTKKKLSIIVKEAWNDPNSVYHTSKYRKKLSLVHKGKKLSKEHKRKISVSLENRTYEEIYGKEKAKEMRKKRRKTRLHQIFPRQDTKIEILIQNELSKRNIQFEKHKPIFGQPDVFIEPNIVVFVDGCYWHGCEKCFDRNNLNGMQRKNIVKDQLVTQFLINQGYVVLRFRGHEILESPSKCVDKIQTTLQTNERRK